MFENTVYLLLGGAFVCRVAHPESFEFLSNEDNLHDTEVFFSKIGRRVAKTSKDSGFFLVYSNYGDDTRAAIRAQYADVKNNIKPIVDFFNLVLRITGQEDILMAGTAIGADTLIGKIDQDMSLRSALQSLGTLFNVSSQDATQRKVLDNVLKRMVANGYLKMANQERAIYQVTAKIEFLLDVIAFIHASDETMKEDDPSAGETGVLV